MNRIGLILMVGAIVAGCTEAPTQPGSAGLSLSRTAAVFNAGGSIASDLRTVQVTNTGSAALEVSPTVTGEDAAQFALQTSPFSLAPGQSRELSIVFTPVAGDLGPQRARVEFGGAAQIALGGLHVNGQNGTLEPSLQWIFDTYGFPLETGDLDPTTSPLVDEAVDRPLGSEIVAQTFVRTNPAQPVTVQVLAAFAVPDVEPIFEFGYYLGSAEPMLTKLLSLRASPALNGQRLEPAVTPAITHVDTTPEGTVSFQPIAEPFGFYSFWPTTRFFDERTVYTEDARNTFDASPHHVRVYPLPIQNGETAYILATDESNRLNDFNDAVLLIRNVRPAAAP